MYDISKKLLASLECVNPLLRVTRVPIRRTERCCNDILRLKQQERGRKRMTVNARTTTMPLPITFFESPLHHFLEEGAWREHTGTGVG